MKKTKLFKTLILILTFFAIFTFGATLVVNAQEKIVWSNINIEEYYNLNEIFIVPERTAISSSGNLDVTHSLTFPNGEKSTADSVKLNQSGKYVLTYYAKDDSNVSLNKKSFFVKYGICSLSSSESSYKYGKHSNSVEKEGLLVRLAEGDCLTFNNTISLSELNVNTTLVKFFQTPDICGAIDYSQINVKLEDIENPNKYFVLNVKHTPESDTLPFSYIKARADGQVLTGLLNTGEPTTTTWGTQVYHTFSGLYFSEPAKYDAKWNILTVSYDAATKGIYVNGMLVIDFDNPDHFSAIWDGFDSDNVRLSIYGDAYRAKTANFCVMEAYGVDIANDVMEDSDAPVIKIDNDYETMPLAIKDYSYPIPTANASDIFSGAVNVDVEVWFNYSSENAFMIPYSNNRFDTNYYGNYSIVYKATDLIGNVATKILNIYCVDISEIEKLSIDISFDIDSSPIGKWVSIPTNAVVEGGCGNTYFSIFAKKGDFKIDITDGNFLPEEIGVWEIEFVATDYIGYKAYKTFYLDVVNNPVPIFNEPVVLPKVFISGADYVLPKAAVCDYSTNSKIVKPATSIEVIDKNGSKIYGIDEVITPEVANNGDKVTIKYIYENAQPLVYEIPTILAWMKPEGAKRDYLQLQNYFYGEGFDIKLDNEFGYITASENGNVGWTFANTLLANNLSIILDSVPDKSNYEKLRIQLTDSLNPKISVAFDIIKNANASSISIDGYRSIMNFGFTEEAKTNQLIFAYNNKEIEINNLYKYQVEETMFGEIFEGFSSNKIYLSISFINAVAEESQYIIEKINRQVIYNAVSDNLEPSIMSIGNNYVCSGLINTNVIIPAEFIASDILDPNINWSLTVYSPNGKIVKDVNNVLLDKVDPTVDYEIKLSMFGQYRVVYVISDTFNVRNNEFEYLYTINVDDSIPPSISFSCKFQKEISVGEKIIIPNITLSDNLDAAKDLVVSKYIIDPNGNSTKLSTKGNSLKTSKVGKYRVIIVVVDTAGNTTYYNTEINVVSK